MDWLVFNGTETDLDKLLHDAPDEPPTGGGMPSPTEGGAPPTVDDETPKPQGQLIVDTRVAEQKIRYPTDVDLLSEARKGDRFHRGCRRSYATLRSG